MTLIDPLDPLFAPMWHKKGRNMPLVCFFFQKSVGCVVLSVYWWHQIHHKQIVVSFSKGTGPVCFTNLDWILLTTQNDLGRDNTLDKFSTDIGKLALTVQNEKKFSFQDWLLGKTISRKLKEVINFWKENVWLKN